MSRNPDKLPPRRVLSANEVCAMLGISRPSLYAWVRNPEIGFPKPVALGPNTVRYRVEDVERWFADRPEVMPGDLQGGE